MPSKKKTATKGTKRKRSANGSKNLFHFDLKKIRAKMEAYCKGEVDPKATIYLTAVLQYVAAEMIELSGNKAREKSAKAAVIKEEDVQAAIQSDEELKKLMVDVSEYK
ncbi:uncharacterized protein [Parasteatoda tepidariorum]|uniref:uncharacterized protein n=1 Tax=Parasteatoda tepidariorum TaxID=114398 RepID=UPI00077F8B81|nr:histone H2A.6-like [Parasteatoda tepidariorum]